jgi:alkaline phosphatase D
MDMGISRRNFNNSIMASVVVPLVPIYYDFNVKANNINRIAILGCIRQYRPIISFKNYVDAKPDLSLWIGDNIYVDTNDKPSEFDRGYDSLSKLQYFKELRQIGTHLATWDDHDFGNNDAFKNYPLKDYSKNAFANFWDLRDKFVNFDDGIYYNQLFSFNGKKLHVIMLDVRYNRDMPDGSGDILGTKQWQWLGETLKQKADLTLLISGSQILLNSETGSETWEDYPKSRTKLFDMIRRNRQENIIFITGDQHYAEVDCDEGGLDFDAIELQFCGLNQIEAPEFNKYRISNVSTSLHSHTYIDIQWDDSENETAHLLFQVFNSETNVAEIKYRYNFTSQKLHLEAIGEAVFDESTNVELRYDYGNLIVRYTIDGQSPNETSPKYEKEILLKKTNTIKAALFDKTTNFKRSNDFEFKFEKAELIKSVFLSGEKRGIKYHYYEGNFKEVPLEKKLDEPVAKGVTEYLNVKTIAKQKDNYAIYFYFYLLIPETGFYQIKLSSDDGSKLWIGERLFINNDGSHSQRERHGFARLQKGFHPIKIGYFEDTHSEHLNLNFAKQYDKKTIDIPLQMFYQD